MIYWLFENYFRSAGLGLRVCAAGAISFFLVLAFGPKVIGLLTKKKVGDMPEVDPETIDDTTRYKPKTPTMGGVLILVSMFISVVLFGNLSNMYIRLGLFALIWLGILGGVDDWLKLRLVSGRGERRGLKSWEKFVFQVALAVVMSNFVYRYGEGGLVFESQTIFPAHFFYIPLVKNLFAISFPVYMIIMTLVMVGSSKAASLTDEMDGLAAGNLLICTTVFLILSWIAGVVHWAECFSIPFVPDSAEMTIFCSAMIGAMLGFLWFNSYPASVFMGDTGSLPLGGLLGYIAVITRQEIVLLIAGGVFVMEVLSIVMQVCYFKYTQHSTGKGKRLFRCAPLHYHLHLCGWPENKVVVRLWILGLLFAVAALIIIKLGGYGGPIAF